MDKSLDPIELATLPAWMAPASAPLPFTSTLATSNEAQLFPAIFDRALDGITSGKPLSQVVEDYPVPIDYTRLLAWIHRDENRRARYYEAQAVGAEVVADQMIAISDASDSLEDVQRSTLRINTRKWLLGVWNRKRYGETRQVEQTVLVDMGEAMAEAMARVNRSRGEVIDVKPRMVE
jgi:hypothetical protein